MLNLIKGRSGTGKTEYVLNKIKELSFKNTDNKIIYIVPEQYSFESEKKLLEFLGPVYSNNILTISFSRLCEMILKNYGKISADYLDTCSKNIIINLTLQKINNDLKFYKNQYNKPDFVKKILKLIDELKMCSIFPEDIIRINSRLTGSLNLKLNDINMVYDVYNTLISRSFVDPADNLNRLYNILKEYSFFKDSYVFIDSFKGFTGAEFNIISEILKTSNETYISLCCDPVNKMDLQTDLFSFINKTEKDLIRLSKKNNINISAPIILTENHRFKNESLINFEKYYLNFEETDNLSYDENITLFEAQTIYEECEYAASAISKLVKTNNFNYNDIVIIARDTKKYDEILTPILSSFNIPFFDDINQPITNKPIFSLLLNSIDMALNGINSEMIFTYLKTNLLDISYTDINLLEDYVYMWNINNKTWLTAWTDNPLGYAKGFNEDSINKLNYLNELRLKIITPILKLSHNLKNKPASNIASDIYDFFNEINLEQNYSNMINKFNSDNQVSFANEQISLWDIMINLLEQINNVLKEEKMPLSNFYNILFIIINSLELTHVPKTRNCITIGSAERIRPSSPKAVFILGANESEFPKTASFDGLFSDTERNNIIGKGLSISESSDLKIIEERYISYLSLTCASDKIYVSYSKNDEKMDSLSPSIIVTEIKRIFPEIKILTKNDLTYKDMVHEQNSAFSFLTKNYTNNDSIINSLKKIFSEQQNYSDKLKLLNKMSLNKTALFANQRHVKKLFSGNLKLSASKVNTFFSCSFMYFLKYGLNTKKRIKAELNSLEYGTLIHYIFENFFLKHADNFLNLDNVFIQSELKQILNDYIKKYNLNSSNDESRQQYLLNKILKTSFILINNIISELTDCKFKPLKFELNIGKDVPPLTINLDDKRTLLIEGKIDRVDIMTVNNINYLRIIDYKTGLKTFKLADILYGLNLQMFIYLLALLKNPPEGLNNVKPAGVLYYTAKSPVIAENRNISDKSLNECIQDELKMNGIITNEKDIISNIINSNAINYLPLSIKKDGTLSAASSVADSEQMNLILNHIEKSLVSMSEKLSKGEIEPSTTKSDSCSFCDYRTACNYKDSDDFIKIKNYKKNEVYEYLLKEEGDTIE